MLVLLGALEEEISGFRDSMDIERTVNGNGWCVYHGSYRGKSLLLVNTGVGKHRAIRACSTVLDRYPVTAMVSLGFAGALKPGCKTGDMFVCSSLVDAGDPSGTRHDTDARLLSLAKACNLKRISCGIGVTSTCLVAAPSAKRSLRESSCADIVDMESYWIGRLARMNGIPFIVGRAVSDTETTSVPELPSYEWNKALSYFIWHPVQGWNLYRGMKRAQKSLTNFAAYIVEVAA